MWELLLKKLEKTEVKKKKKDGDGKKMRNEVIVKQDFLKKPNKNIALSQFQILYVYVFFLL